MPAGACLRRCTARSTHQHGHPCPVWRAAAQRTARAGPAKPSRAAGTSGCTHALTQPPPTAGGSSCGRRRPPDLVVWQHPEPARLALTRAGDGGCTAMHRVAPSATKLLSRGTSLASIEQQVAGCRGGGCPSSRCALSKGTAPHRNTHRRVWCLWGAQPNPPAAPLGCCGCSGSVRPTHSLRWRPRVGGWWRCARGEPGRWMVGQQHTPQYSVHGNAMVR